MAAALTPAPRPGSDTTTASAAAQKTREDTALERHLARLANGEVIMDVKKTKTKAALRAAREVSVGGCQLGDCARTREAVQRSAGCMLCCAVTLVLAIS